LFVLPSLLILIGLSWLYLADGQVAAVAGVLYGIKPAVTAIVLFAAYRIGARALKNGLLWMMAALAFLAIFLLNAPLPLIVLLAGILGAIGGKWLPEKFALVGGHGAAKQSYGPALIDDDTPTTGRPLWFKSGVRDRDWVFGKEKLQQQSTSIEFRRCSGSSVHRSR
jgi:chromate transporter